MVESVQALAKEFGDFAHDVEAAYHNLNSFGSDTAAMKWIGQTADAFKNQYGPLPGRLQKLYTSYSEASDALSAYAPLLQAAQTKADTALRQAQDAHADLQRATSTANNAATDLKTAQQNQAANPNQQAVTDAQTAHDTAQTNLNNAKAKMAALTKQANDAYNDRITAAKTCGSALHKAQGDGIHNKSWWDHVAEDLSDWGGEIAKVAGELAPILMVVALATSWIPGVDVVTAALAEADNLVALAGTAMATIGDAMQGHWGDALLGVGMLGLAAIGAGGEGEALEGEAGALEGEAEGAESAVGDEARTAEGNSTAVCKSDPIDVVSGWMLTDATDLELPGALPVVLRRAYSSGYSAGRLFGPGWSSTLDQRLSINAAGIHVVGDDAQRLDYPAPTGDREVLPSRGGDHRLVWDRETDEIRVTDWKSGQVRHFAVVHYQSELGQIRDLTAITDRNGNRISIERDAQGTPVAVVHPGYRVGVDTVVTEAGPRVSAIRLADGDSAGAVVKQFHYDQRGRLREVVNSAGAPFCYEWDENDRIQAWTDRTGFRYGYVYDGLGRVIHGESEFLAGSFAYDPENRTTVHTDSLGNATTFRYDEHGHVCSETDPLGRTTSFEVDREGRVLSRSDALGAVVVFDRDEAGDIRRVVDPTGAVTALEYNGFHQLLSVTEPDGATWRREYDARGNLVLLTDPAGAATRLEYSAVGALAAVTDPLGATTRFTADAAGLVVAQVDPLGNTTHAVRDAAGRVVAVVDALGATSTIEWSLDGRPVSRTDANGSVVRWRHDVSGRLTEIIDPAGASTRFEPGPMGTLAARTGPDGVRRSFTYDSELKLLAVANPDGASWSYSYDQAGQLVAETDFTGRRLEYAYDVAGRLIARTTGTGQEILMDRDLAGRVVARHTPEGEYRYSYDPMGRLVQACGPGTSLTYERDPLGQVLAETVDGRTTRYAYDAAGRRTGRITASGAESAWSYDAAGRSVALAAGGGLLETVFDATGRPTQRDFGGGGRLTRQYDQGGRRVAEGLGLSGDAGDVGNAALSRTWNWSLGNFPEAVSDSLRGDRRFVSDTSGRVTSVTAHGWTETYAYDAYGNLATAGGADGVAADADPEVRDVSSRTLIRQSGRTHYEYDSAARLVRTVRRTLDGRRKTWTYTWDSQDRLVQTTTPDRGTWSYEYDAVGRRTGKYRVTDEGTAADRVQFTWDGPRLAEQMTDAGDGVVVMTWDYDPGTFRPAAQRRRRRGAGGDADQGHFDEAFHAIVTDLIGTPTELVTPEGRIAWHATASLWGRTDVTHVDPEVDCPLRFPGQYHDDETGLHYNLYRYYNPETAAYLTPDQLGLAPSPNDHAYVPNPLTHLDPLGLCAETVGDGDGYSGDERYRVGVAQDGVERTLDNSLDKNTYLRDVAQKYGINLRGSGQDIDVVFDPDLAPGLQGVTRAVDGGRVINIGPAGIVDDTTAANTIAHELSHARYFLRNGSFEGEVHGGIDSMGDGTPYGSGNALQDWIEGNR
ncbi:DUF6531 domain-containing protein [Catenulispora sp. MAP12-49]|uniref:DUF6531 domain-containing protein n=1 Tax=Catenulispora sp. MAP12-49 TaxID=3156302 RepID=UPI00351679A0